MKRVIQEVLWLLIILIISLPLASGLNALLTSAGAIINSPVKDLLADSNQVLQEQLITRYMELYCLVIIGCYVARLAANGAKSVVAKVPEDF